ncbi:unnamed protein product [Closterium sp. NIES-65]|nr:unnamed protein product [Closterium sp. NIES-65]
MRSSGAGNEGSGMGNGSCGVGNESSGMGKAVERGMRAVEWGMRAVEWGMRAVEWGRQWNGEWELWSVEWEPSFAWFVSFRQGVESPFFPSSPSFSPASPPPNLLPVLFPVFSPPPTLLSPRPPHSPASSLPRRLSPASFLSPSLPRLLSPATSATSLSPSLPRLLAPASPPPSLSTDVLNYRGLVWRLLDQWPSSARPRQQSPDLTAISSSSASLFASGNETWGETSETSQGSANATWDSYEPSQDAARTTWATRDGSEMTMGESTGGEHATTSDAEGAASGRAEAAAVGMSHGWRKWRGHVVREERPLGQRRQMADSWLDGPCSDYVKAPVISISSLADFNKRLDYGPVTTVILELQRNLVISKGILFDSKFSCTILRSAKTAANPFQITHMGANEPVLRIWNTSNVLVLKVDFRLSVRSSSPTCTTVPEITAKAQCPTISVIRSYGIQIAKGSVFGRIDLHRSASSRVDSMRVTGIPTFNQSPGVIQVTYSGHGPTLAKSFIAITNNEVYGVNTPIVVHRGSVGVIVRNNYVHDFIFAGIRCGSDVHFAGDCMLTQIDRNLVVASGRNRSGDQDAAGIYYCVHWFSPGES